MLEGLGVSCVLLDTHSFIWSLVMTSELSTTPRDMIEAADAAYDTASMQTSDLASELRPAA